MKSAIVKRSIVIAGHKTSLSLEDAFWESLQQIARGRGQNVHRLATTIDENRHSGNLSSAIRLFVLGFYRDQPYPQSGTRVRLAA
jgi:predicted DNA-binding ribbon-helix-helix protein